MVGLSTQKNINSLMSQNNKLLLSFIVILLISLAGYLLILDKQLILQPNLPVWYLLHIIWISSIVLTGYVGWRTQSKKWIGFMWLAIYFFGIILFFILGLVDNYFFKFPYRLRVDISKIRLFFFGPVPFVILYFISRVADRSAKATNH